MSSIDDIICEQQKSNVAGRYNEFGSGITAKWKETYSFKSPYDEPNYVPFDQSKDPMKRSRGPGEWDDIKDIFKF